MPFDVKVSNCIMLEHMNKRDAHLVFDSSSIDNEFVFYKENDDGERLYNVLQFKIVILYWWWPSKCAIQNCLNSKFEQEICLDYWIGMCPAKCLRLNMRNSNGNSGLFDGK